MAAEAPRRRRASHRPDTAAAAPLTNHLRSIHSMFNTNTKTGRLALVAVVITMVTMSAGVAFAAAPTVDTETTDTTTTSELTDGDAQTYNDTTASYFNWSADSTNSKIVVEQGDTELFSATPEVETDASGTYYYNVSLADDGSDYSDLDVGANENATLNVTLINNTEADSPDTTNVSITFANGDEKAWVNADTAATEETDDGILSSVNVFSSGDDVPAAQSERETTITNNTDTVEVSASSSNLSDALGETTSEKSEGDLVWTATAMTGDSFVPVVYQSADDGPEWLDTDEDTYAVLSEDGSTLTVMNAGKLADEDGTTAFDMTVTGNEALGFSNAFSMLRSYDAGIGTSALAASSAADFNGAPTFGDEE